MNKSNVNLGERIKQVFRIKKKTNSFEFNAHWYRRVFHTFGASFLVYYLLPYLEWINLLKLWLSITIVAFALVLESMRLTGKINSGHFFGLRIYEKKRFGSYLYFGVGVLILLLFFPQQIAVPCILCACIADPIMGELRNNLGKKQIYTIGFLICMFIFLITWYKADVWMMCLISIVGAGGAVFGEVKKIWWLDDDFMIQIIPAFLLLIIWIIISYFGFVLPEPMIYSW